MGQSLVCMEKGPLTFLPSSVRPLMRNLATCRETCALAAALPAAKRTRANGPWFRAWTARHGQIMHSEASSLWNYLLHLFSSSLSLVSPAKLFFLMQKGAQWEKEAPGQIKHRDILCLHRGCQVVLKRCFTNTPQQIFPQQEAWGQLDLMNPDIWGREPVKYKYIYYRF